MQKRPTISVIVPVYKAEQYLPRCIDSILSQEFTDFELLLIDDGSPDGSGKLCDEYAARDSRIKVFHKENGGVSSARNLGLDKACGEWISFIDADDYLSPGFFDLGEIYNCDVIQKSYNIVYEGSDKIEQRTVPENDFNTKDDFYRFYINKRTNALWDKFIRRELIGNKRFNTNVHIGEDFLFFLSLLSNIKGYKFNNKGYYYYIIRKGSAMDQINKNARDRAQIMINNIQNIVNILDNKKDVYLRDGIIYLSYINTLYDYRKHLDQKSLKIVKRYYKEMSLSKLKYVDNYIKIKLLIKRILIKFF